MVVRVVWLVISVVAVGYAVSSAGDPVSGVSLGCAKIGEYGADTAVRCDDSIAQVFGAWRLVLLGALLSGPPLLAAFSRRRSVWWLAVVALVVVGLTGLAMWTTIWILLLVALPLAGVGSVAVMVDTAVRVSRPERS